MFEARAFAGLDRDAIQKLEEYEVPKAEFESWLKDEFRVSRSYFIRQEVKFWGETHNDSYIPDLGERKKGEWSAEDVLFRAALDKDGAIIGYLSVDDPVDASGRRTRSSRRWRSSRPTRSWRSRTPLSTSG
jgi:hypothetical protein